MGGASKHRKAVQGNTHGTAIGHEGRAAIPTLPYMETWGLLSEAGMGVEGRNAKE